MEIDFTFKPKPSYRNGYLFEYKLFNYNSVSEYYKALSIIQFFLNEIKSPQINSELYDVNIWFVNFFSFYLIEYYLKKRKDNFHKEYLVTGDDVYIVYFKIYMTLHQLEFMFKKLKVIIDSKDIYGWIDKEISKNSELIKNKYLLEILSHELKDKYNHLIQATNFNLI
jgi:hypothetical protein